MLKQLIFITYFYIVLTPFKMPKVNDKFYKIKYPAV